MVNDEGKKPEKCIERTGHKLITKGIFDTYAEDMDMLKIRDLS